MPTLEHRDVSKSNTWFLFFLTILLETCGSLACEGRRISGGRFSPPKNSVCETELQNDFCDVKFLANQNSAYKSPEPTRREHAKYLRVVHVNTSQINGGQYGGYQKDWKMRSSMLRPRRNAMSSSIYLHDLESPCLMCSGPCGGSSGKKYCDCDLPITNSFQIVLLEYSTLRCSLVSFFSNSGRDNALS